MQDAIDQFYVTASARLLEVTLQTAGTWSESSLSCNLCRGWERRHDLRPRRGPQRVLNSSVPV
jgi:hypothetical protein